MLAGAGGSGAAETLAPFDLSPVALAHEPPFDIGDVEFRPATRELIRDGQASVVEPRVMQLLVALRRANGAVVSKDDLGQLVWEGRIVGEDAINRVVSRLRAVAERQAGGVFRVDTITKVGYRLIGASGANSPLVTIPVTPKRRANVMRRREMLIGGSAAMVIGAAALVWWHGESTKLPAEARDLLENGRKSMYDGTVDQLSNAIGALRQAAQIAPHSPDVWGSLAYAYMKQSLEAPAQDRAELLARANAATARAFSLEPQQADALAAQITGMRLFRNWLAVDRASRAALRRHPHHIGLQLNFAGALIRPAALVKHSMPSTT